MCHPSQARSPVTLNALSHVRWFVLSAVILFVFSSDCLGQCDPTMGDTHIIKIDDQGRYSHAKLEINHCDTVVWKSPDRKRTIIPLQSNGVNPPDQCDAYKPFDPDDPNDCTGLMPRAASGIFILGPNQTTGVGVLSVPPSRRSPQRKAVIDHDRRKNPLKELWVCTRDDGSC